MSKCSPCDKDQFLEDLLNRFLNDVSEAKLPNISKPGDGGGEEDNDGDEEEEEQEELEPQELLDWYKTTNRMYSWEGSSGVRKFTEMVKSLGYRDLDDFLSDNSGALDAMEEFIRTWLDRSDEWVENLRNEVEEYDGN